MNAAKSAETANAAPESRTVPGLEAEVAKLRKELAETRMERDIVKKAEVGSTGQRDTGIKFTSWRFKSQGFSWSLI